MYEKSRQGVGDDLVEDPDKGDDALPVPNLNATEKKLLFILWDSRCVFLIGIILYKREKSLIVYITICRIHIMICGLQPFVLLKIKIGSLS